MDTSSAPPERVQLVRGSVRRAAAPAPAPAPSAAGSPRPATLTGAHFAVAVFYLVAGAAGLAWAAPQIAGGDVSSPRLAGVTHCFTLGWITTSIFGTLYHLLPGALGAPIRWPRAGYASIAALAPGIGMFASGVATGAGALGRAGVALVAVGVALAVIDIAVSLARAGRRDTTWTAVVIAITYLSLALILGSILFHNLRTGFIAGARIRVLVMHLHVAAVGWALIMMVGVSDRLLPMFLLAHGADKRWNRLALGLLALGLPVLASGLVADVAPAEWLGAVLLEIGVACFLYQASRFFRARVRKRIEVGMYFAAVALGFLAVDLVLGPLVLWRGTTAPRLAMTYVLIGVLGGIVLFIIGFYYKIAPTLAWNARYGGKATPDAPSIGEMVSARVARVQWALMTGALLLLAGAALSGSRLAAYAGAGAFLLGALLFAGQMSRLGSGRRSA